MKRLASLVMAVSLILILSAPTGSLAAEKLNFSTSFRGPQFQMVTLAALEKGFFKQNGLDAKWFEMRGSNPNIQALISGSVDVAMEVVPSVIQGATRGLPMIIVADTGYTEDWALWVRKDGPIKTGAQLRGQKVGTNRFGGSAYAFAQVLLKDLGLVPMKDAKIVAVGGLSARVAALKSGVIAAFPLGMGAGTNLEAKGLIRPLNYLKPLLPNPWIDLVLGSLKGFAEKNPQLVTRTIKSVLQAANFVQNNPGWTKQKLASYSKLAPGALDGVYALLKYSKDGRISPKAIENVRNFLIEYKIVPKDKAPEVRAIYSNKYLP